MEVQDISKVMNAYISNQEMLGGALIVEKMMRSYIRINGDFKIWNIADQLNMIPCTA